MQYVVVASRRYVLDVDHRIGEWLTGYCVSDATLHPDVGLAIMKPSKHNRLFVVLFVLVITCIKFYIVLLNRTS